MKRYFFTLLLALSIAVTASAMNYHQAKQHALFLADKMAYELNLTEEQYEAVYEINLDYLLKVDCYDDVFGVYWDRRNADLRYILFDWQYRDFLNASYFYRPLHYSDGYWRFSLYSRYPRRDYYYFGEPRFYTYYQGGHSWYNNNNKSWYYGRSFGNGAPGGYLGMRDAFDGGSWRYNSQNVSPSRRNSDLYNDNGYYYDNSYNNRYTGRSYDSFGNRQSSTRVTVEQMYGGFRSSDNQTFDGNSSSRSSNMRSFGGSTRSGSSFESRSNSSSGSSFGSGSPSRR